jgi:hypothetical protein
MIERDENNERQIRVAAILEETRLVRERAEAARQKAHELFDQARDILQRIERPTQRERLLPERPLPRILTIHLSCTQDTGYPLS